MLAVVAFFISLLPAAGSNLPATEARVKAAFLLNFPKYVEWPTNSFAEANSPFVVGIFGDEEIAEEFQKMIKGKTVNGRPIELRVLSAEEQCDGPFHILFIASKRKEAVRVLERMRNRPVLTVGDNAVFTEKDGVINLVRREQHVRMQVNLFAARDAQLKVSSKLLAVADEVKGGRSN